MWSSQCTVPCYIYQQMGPVAASCFLLLVCELTFLCVTKITAEIVLKKLGATVQNLASCNMYTPVTDAAIMS